MPKVSIVNKEELVKNARCDSDFFSPAYITLYSKLSKMNSEPLYKVANVTDGNHLSIAEQFVESGVRYLRGQDVTEFFMDDSKPVFIPEDAYWKLRRSHVKTNDILLSIVGTIGNIALVRDREKKLTANCKLAIIRPRSIEPEYLYMYLASKYGQIQIRQNIRGTIQKGLILPDLKRILVVELKKECRETIRSMVNEAHSIRQESLQLLEKAKQLFLSEVDMKNTIMPTLSHQKAFSNIKKANRMDAEYFDPKYANAFERIMEVAEEKSWDLKTIGQISEPLRYGTSEKLTYLDKGIPFLRITDIRNFDFDPDSLCHISEEEAKKVAYAKVQEGDLLISRSGTLGLTIRIGKDLANSIFGSYFIRIRPKIEINREYLAFYLNSFLGKIQVEQISTGAVQTNLTIPAIKNMRVLKPKKEFQEKIASLLTESKYLKERAKSILKDAIVKIESEIERNSKS